jgi:hypothetical protein
VVEPWPNAAANAETPIGDDPDDAARVLTGRLSMVARRDSWLTIQSATLLKKP